MKHLKIFTLLTFTIISVCIATAQQVKIVGQMKDVMKKGKLFGNINLDTIENKEHLYLFIDYDYSKEETEKGAIHTLFASDQDHWNDSFKDKEVLSITDTGDGFVFNHSCPEEEMDYHYALQLSILLSLKME